MKQQELTFGSRLDVLLVVGRHGTWYVLYLLIQAERRISSDMVQRMN
jgi:hypothetical protein